MTPRPLALTLALLLGAGCLTAADETPTPSDGEDAGAVVIDEARPDTTFTDVQTGAAAAPDEAATLETPPQLRVGEWWRIKTESDYGLGTAEYVRVMAETTPEGYVFGMPHEGWYKEAVIFHFPFFGDVNPDLSGKAHDIPFVPLQFPLVDGATWTTQYMGPPDLTATVDADEDAKTATVTFTDPSGAVFIELVYDAKIHEIVEYRHEFLSFKVVEHGYDFQGWVTVPRGVDLIFLDGRVGQALGASGSAEAPSETIEVTGGYNRLTVMAARGDVGLLAPALGSTASAAPGVYGIKITDAAGESYEMAPAPMAQGFDMAIFESPNVDGTWTLDYTAAGAGGVFVMGIAYHQYDIKVPTLEKRSDHSHPVVR